ncbi:MAG: hypothetical protein K8823_1552 [Cenarchaeum symbiont of Oopsacas minuta]|nr:hypothetical protein [Cenarchaeum symbiont of Oopsacas minuta]
MTEDQIYINRIVIRNKGTNTARVAGFYSAAATPGVLPYNYGYATAFLQVPGIDRPFTYVSIDKGKSLILKRDVVQESNTNHKVIFYVRGAAEPDLTIDFYKNSVLQGTEVAVYDQESQTCTVPLNFEFDELHINVLDTTNGFGINLGGVSIENNDLVQMKDWTSAIISEPAIFPFDSKIETDVSVTQGTWFLESVGIKTVQRVIISDPNNEANSEIRVQVYVDNAWLTIHTGSIEAGAGIITLEINDIARTFDHFRLLSSKTFRVHEIVISGTAFTDLTGGSVVFHDNTGILDKYGTWSYRTNTIYKDQSNLESVNSSQVFVK